jgi:diguanylate cyclase (GGDEF)-like protein/PAS domain S-box-containing protein
MLVRCVHACFGAWILALAVAFYALPAFSMYSWAAIGLSSAAAVLVGVRLHRPARKLPWYLLCGVLLSFTAGDTTYNVLVDFLHRENPFPSVADLFYLAVYPMLAGALLIFIRARAGGDNRAPLLDAMLPTAGLGLLSWVFLISPYVHDGTLTLPEKLVSVGYPLGDVLALAMVLRLVTTPGRKQVSIWILVGGVSALLITDVLYGLRQLAGTWLVGGPTDFGWIVFYAALGFSALHPSMNRLTAAGDGASRNLAGGRRIVAMSAASLIAPAVLLVEDLCGGIQDAPMISAACALMFLLVMARVTGLLTAQRETLARERTLREAGMVLVAATSEKEAAGALNRAVAELMPLGAAYRIHMVGVDTDPAAEPSGFALHTVDVADLPAEVALHLRGFECAVYTEVHTPARLKKAFLAAAPETLSALRPSIEALMAQCAMAIERIALTVEINRRSNEDYFRTLIQSASDVILIVGDDDLIRYASPSAVTVFGYPDLVGTPLSGLIAGTDHDGLRDVVNHLHGGRRQYDGVDLAAVRSDGRLLQVECGARDLRDDPTVAGLVFTIRDVTERRRLETDLAHQAFHDALTGLANRALFQNRLQQAALLAERTGAMVGVLFIDLDDFKEVNDTLGHAVGDQLLVAVAERIRLAVGPLNTASRTGGDEFAVLVEQVRTPGDADEVAARIVAALAAPVELSDGSGGFHVLNGAASVGVATSAEASTITELQRQADIALYGAKSEGKKTWQRYQSALHTGVVERLELRAALNDAVPGDQLVLRFQPIVDLHTEQTIGLEALVRWQHPVRGLIGPTEFIELAEQNGSIVAIGSWVLRESLRIFVNWRIREDNPLRYLSVNVSARQFRTPGFVDLVRQALADTGARPEWLLLEITESLVLHDAEQVWADLRALRELGIRIAIDDFGTGYSSLSYLRQMPVDVLKIDKSFIDDILHSTQQCALVEAIVSLARTLNLAVVAEGIEDPAHQRVLAEMGCPYGQGYLFSKPVSEDEMSALLIHAPLVNGTPPS